MTALDITCPGCGEKDKLTGTPATEAVSLNCDVCGATWQRLLMKRCAECGGDDLQTIPLAIVEKSRGTQLSVVGTRPVELCSACDDAVLRHYHDHRPNPLMPADLPTVGEEHLNG